MDLRRLTQVEAHEIRMRAKLHRENLVKIKHSPASVDSRPPKTRMLPHIKRKREKCAQERSLREKEIQRENVRIMERMTKILNEQHYKDAKAEQQRASKTQRAAREKVRRMSMSAIERENVSLKRRLQATQPVYSKQDWLADRKVKERYLHTLAVYKSKDAVHASAPRGPSPRARRASLRATSDDMKPSSSAREAQTSPSATSKPLAKRAESWRETAIHRLQTIVLHRLPAPQKVSFVHKSQHAHKSKRAEGVHVIKGAFCIGSVRSLVRMQWVSGAPDVTVTLFDSRTHQSHDFKFAKRLLRRWLNPEHRHDPSPIMQLCLAGLRQDADGIYEIHLPPPPPSE